MYLGVITSEIHWTICFPVAFGMEMHHKQCACVCPPHSCLSVITRYQHPHRPYPVHFFCFVVIVCGPSDTRATTDAHKHAMAEISEAKTALAAAETALNVAQVQGGISCRVKGCRRLPWDGNAWSACCRTCVACDRANATPRAHGNDCNAKHALLWEQFQEGVVQLPQFVGAITVSVATPFQHEPTASSSTQDDGKDDTEDKPAKKPKTEPSEK